MKHPDYARDLRGRGRQPPHAQWPGGARVAVQFVLNVEEGGENNPLHGDATSETFLSEIVGAQAYANRHMSMESMYEYGPRVGVWRILREFDARGLPLTIFGVVTALQRYPQLLQHFIARGDEIANHGLRWIAHQAMPAEQEREQIATATALMQTLLQQAAGSNANNDAAGGGSTIAACTGWYTGRDSPNTRRLVVEQGGYDYDSDYYGDDLPFWLQVQTGSGDGELHRVPHQVPRLVPHLVVPYALDTNDMRFVQAQGFNTGEHFFSYLRDAFDALYAEGELAPKMMSVGMHSRLLGKPGRIGSLQRFLDHIGRHERVWVCRRIDIARHWTVVHPFDPATAFVWQ
ncbi:MAG: allantoinase PuuE [Rubrivivax sp.]|nr:allantoinase PuuE [Rubrivivax sp.]